MSVRFDLHLHSNRYSPCSRINPEHLLQQAERAGLDGLVLTEHHHQWDDEELRALADASGVPGMVLLAGFEYTSSQGDLLTYGLDAKYAKEFAPGEPPEVFAEAVRRLGGVCIAAHPTRAGLSFDERIETLPLAGIEVCSVNMRRNERRLALRLAKALGVPPTASSDAHDLKDVGSFCTSFDAPIQSRSDLLEALRLGAFRMEFPSVMEARTT